MHKRLVASVGVVAGRALVAYELREKRLFAISKAKRSLISEWADISKARIESEIFEIYVKSFESPESLRSRIRATEGSASE